MSGLNHAASFKDLGVEKSTEYKAPVSAFTLPTKTKHAYLFDPTRRTTFDEARVQSIMEFGCDAPLHVVRIGHELVIQRGGKRYIDGMEAARRNKKLGKPEPMFRYILIEQEEQVSKDMQRVENFHRHIPTQADYALEVARMRRESYPDARICFLLRLTDREGQPLEGKKAKVKCDEYAAIAGADPVVLAALGEKKIGAAQAAKLSRQPRESQQEKVGKIKQDKARGEKAKAIVNGTAPKVAHSKPLTVREMHNCAHAERLPTFTVHNVADVVRDTLLYASGDAARLQVDYIQIYEALEATRKAKK